MKCAIKANIPINENDAIARGISSLVTASSISWPMPGHEKIDSVNTEPSIIVIMVKIKDVTTGIAKPKNYDLEVFRLLKVAEGEASKFYAEKQKQQETLNKAKRGR